MCVLFNGLPITLRLRAIVSNRKNVLSHTPKKKLENPCLRGLFKQQKKLKKNWNYSAVWLIFAAKGHMEDCVFPKKKGENWNRVVKSSEQIILRKGENYETRKMLFKQKDMVYGFDICFFAFNFFFQFHFFEKKEVFEIFFKKILLSKPSFFIFKVQ